MKTYTILGLDFFGGTSREAVEEITRRGGLLVAPAAPSMINLCRDEDYRRAVLGADLAIADSGFMVLLWKLFTGEKVPRISGLEHVKRLLEHESVRQPGAVVWVVGTESSRAKLVAFLSGEPVRLARSGRRPAIQPKSQRTGAGGQRTEDGGWNSEAGGQKSEVSVSDFSFSETIYVAPQYDRPVEDESLLALVRQIRPKHVVIAIGGGIQDKLGRYLLERLNYRPAVHCIGAALGFLTGDQVRIPEWADKYYFGWFFRSVAQPRIFVPRFWSARRLPWLIFQWREKLPPLGKS
ncbi:MAG TPA: WecB/TagA/CpsF family glycosyltransferase [Chthoniobacterales bacterium]|nr:WecB/TagA/CpsF family glycosyltransferase [Chthoniobacterales bacterium]